MPRLISRGVLIELAEDRRQFLLLGFFHASKDSRDALLEERDRGLVEFGALVCENYMHDAPVILISLAQDQLFFLEAVDDTGQVADRHHHLRADLAEGQLAGIADSRQNIELRRRQPGFFQIAFELFVRLQPKAEKPHPETGCVRGEERPFVNSHECNSSRRVVKKQLRFRPPYSMAY